MHDAQGFALQWGWFLGVSPKTILELGTNLSLGRQVARRYFLREQNDRTKTGTQAAQPSDITGEQMEAQPRRGHHASPVHGGGTEAVLHTYKQTHDWQSQGSSGVQFKRLEKSGYDDTEGLGWIQNMFALAPNDEFLFTSLWGIRVACGSIFQQTCPCFAISTKWTPLVTLQKVFLSVWGQMCTRVKCLHL